jgi:single-strand DNA-binding protein
MPNYNKIVIIGHLGKDPETKYTKDGKNVANFSVAVSEKWGGNEHTEWFYVVAWNKTAEIAQKFLKKGNPVLIEGKIQTREWNSTDGEKKKTTELIASNIVLLGGKVTAPANLSNDQQFDSPDDSLIPF